MRPIKKWGLGLFAIGLLGFSASIYACNNAEGRKQVLYEITGLVSFVTAGVGAAMYDLSRDENGHDGFQYKQ